MANSMDVMLDAKLITMQLRNLSRDPANKPFIARDEGCLAGLVRFLTHEDESVVALAVEALCNLASCDDNKRLMTSQTGLLAGVVRIASSKPLDADCAYYALGTFNRLRSVLSASEAAHWQSKLPAAATDDSASAPSTSLYTPARGPGRSSTFRVISESSRLSQSHKLHLKTLRDAGGNSIQSDVEMLLLRTPGVISVTVDATTMRATVFTSGTLSSAALIAALAPLTDAFAIESSGTTPAKKPGRTARTSTASAAPRTPLGERNANSTNAPATSPPSSPKPASPKYLDDAMAEENIGPEAVVTRGSSLQERLAAQKRRRAREQQAAAGGSRVGFFGKLGRALWIV